MKYTIGAVLYLAGTVLGWTLWAVIIGWALVEREVRRWYRDYRFMVSGE